MKKTERLPYTRYEKTANLICILIIIAMATQIALVYPGLPERIPMHFNAAGQPDGFGGRGSLWGLWGTSVGMYVFMTACTVLCHQFSTIMNVPFVPKPENRERAYQSVMNMVANCTVLMISLLGYVQVSIIGVTTGQLAGLGIGFMPVVLAGFAAVIVGGVVRYRRIARA